MTIKISRILVFGILFFLANCKVPNKAKSVAKSTTENNSNLANNTLLWKVSGNGLTKPSYIFGTMHLLCSDDAILSDSLTNILNIVEKIYFELDMDDMGQMMSALTKMPMKNNVKLKDLLSPQEYAKVKDYFANHKSMIPFSMMESFKPFLISSTLIEEEMSCAGGGISGIEMKMMEYNNKKNKKETLGLETIDTQLGIFDSIPYKDQAKMLLQYLDSMDITKKENQNLVNAYKKQNLSDIENLMAKSEPGMNQYMDLLLYSRNRNWIKSFKEILPKNSIIAAVGAGHLVGDQGIINLLKKEGFILTPIPN